jgi:capsular polysaccharide biosynthesis protein
MYKYEFEIDVFRCMRSLFKHKGFIAIITALCFLVGLGMTLDLGEDKYTSVATVYAAADSSYSEATAAVTAMNAYLDVATSYKVSQRAALLMGRSDVDASDIQSAVGVNSSLKRTSSTAQISSFLNSSATIISFYATTTDPELSREIADAVADSYVIEMANILKFDAVKNLDSAGVGYLSFDASSEAWKDRIKYMLLGFVLACIFVVACEIFDSKTRTIREATIRGQLPVIGVIPDYKD